MLNFPSLPPYMRQASEKQKGKNWFVELLIFFLVFLIASILSGFLMIPGYVIAVISDSSIMELFLSGASSVEEYSRIAALMESSLPVTLSMLFANAGLILIAILFCVIFQKRKVSSMGFIKEKAGTQYLIGMGIGFLLFGAVTLINIITGAMTIEGISENFSFGVFLLFALGFAIQGMAEEVLCRGYFMVSVSRRYSVITAVLLNSLVFSLLHLANPGVSVAAIVNIVLFGVVLSLYFLRTGNIWGIGAIHSVWNFVQGNVFGMEVSGLDLSCTVFQSSTAPDKVFWNGGVFGAEGGFSTTIVLVAAVLILLFWRKRSGVTTRENEGILPHTENEADMRLG